MVWWYVKLTRIPSERMYVLIWCKSWRVLHFKKQTKDSGSSFLQHEKYSNIFFQLATIGSSSTITNNTTTSDQLENQSRPKTFPLWIGLLLLHGIRLAQLRKTKSKQYQAEANASLWRGKATGDVAFCRRKGLKRGSVQDEGDGILFHLGENVISTRLPLAGELRRAMAGFWMIFWICWTEGKSKN